jgi:HAD-superfamily subfamily IB hydrolase, TIGR01490
MQKENKPVIAVFDFDKTITAKHTFIRFFQRVSGPYQFYLVMMSLVPQMIRYKVGSIDLMTLREKAIQKFFHELSEDDYKKHCKQFVKDYINHWLLEEAINKINWHKSQNHKLVLLSNSPEDYLKIWADQFGFDFVLGSRFEFKNGMSTGKISGDHCFGSEKVKRLKAVLGDTKNYYIYGYGDSKGDLDFLNMSDEAFYKHFNLKKNFTYENSTI